MSEDFSSKISKIKSTLYEYLYVFETGPHLIYDNELNKVRWDNSKDDFEAKKYIVRLGKLLSHLRCIAKTWNTEGTQGSDYGFAVSQPEDPRHAITVLRNLARAHALLPGRNYITIEDIPIVAKTVLSTAQTERVSIFYLLLDNDGDVSTDDIMRYLNVARPTALRTMTELNVIGLVEEYEYKATKHIRLRDGFKWFL
jgi:AAA lid domain